MGKDPDVTAAADGDAFFDRYAKGDGELAHRRAVRIAFSMFMTIARNRIPRRKGGKKGATLARHQREGFTAALITVLDCVTTGLKRAADGFVTRGMYGYRSVQIMRTGNGGLQFIFPECRSGFTLGTDAIVAIELDPVRPMCGLVADCPHDLPAAADFFSALRQTAVGPEETARRAIAAAGNDRPAYNLKTRARHEILSDRSFEGDVSISSAFGTQVAQRREAGKERSMGMANCADSAIGRCLIEYLIVPAGFAVGVKEKMGVRIDVQNWLIRVLLNFTLTLLCGAIYLFIYRGMLGMEMQWNWVSTLVQAVGNSLIAMLLFPLLDRFQRRD